MTEPVKRLYKEAKQDLEYQQKLKDVGEEYHKPKLWWDNNTKVMFATVYMGYLVGLNRYKESNYYY